MAFSLILDEIETILSGTTGVANVYKYSINESQRDELETKIVSGTTVHWWEIKRISAPATAFTRGQTFRQHTFELLGHYGLDTDAATPSEITFGSLIDTIMNEFNLRTNFALNGTADQIKPPDLVEQFETTLSQGGNALVHFCRIHIFANEEVTISS